MPPRSIAWLEGDDVLMFELSHNLVCGAQNGDCIANLHQISAGPCGEIRQRPVRRRRIARFVLGRKADDDDVDGHVQRAGNR